MKTTFKTYVLLAIILVSAGCVEPVQNYETISEQEVRALFDTWNNTLQTGDPNQVAALYAENGVLLPTVSNQVRTNHEEIADYFVNFLKYQPHGTINESHVRVFNGVAFNSGVYTFKLLLEDEAVEVQARYTFAYHFINGEWLIVEHHSSAMPE